MRKMKTLALVLLLFALIGSIISWPYHKNFWGGLILSACEAALVGALADWFAVVAIFRHPLGLKFIPHTAIIPNNRERIIDSIVYMVENEWLKLDVIRKKIKDYKVIEGVSNILQTDKGRERLKILISSIVLSTVKNVEAEHIVKFAQNIIVQNYLKIKISSENVKKMEKTLKELYGDDIIDFFIDIVGEVLNKPEFLRVTQNTLRKAANDYAGGKFIRRMTKGIGESLDLINYGEAAQALVRRLEDIAEGLKSEHNPYRSQIKQGLMNFNIGNPQDLSVLLEKWTYKLIHSEEGSLVILEVINAIKENIAANAEADASLINYLVDIIIIQLDNISMDESKKLHFERWIKDEVLKIVERYHGLIGKLVKENLQILNDERFVESLEDRVGDDLQWIRVNGTVIGAVVGIIQYLVLSWIT